MEQALSKSKPWYLPVWLMMGMMIFNCFENVFVFEAIYRIALYPIRWYVISIVMLWPSIILIEAIIYWFIRKKIVNRRWVWAHLLFSLFAFVLLFVLYFGILAILYAHTDKETYSSNLRLMQKIQSYAFWAGVIAGHIFFVVAIVRSFSVKKFPEPCYANDLLSEVADLKH